MLNRLAILLLFLASGFVFSSCTFAQSCGSVSYPPLSGWSGNMNVHSNYSTAINNAMYGNRQISNGLPKKTYTSYRPQSNSIGYATSAPIVGAPAISTPISYGYSPSYAANPVPAYAPVAPIFSSSYAAPTPNFIQGNIGPIQSGPTCSNGTCRFK